MNQLDNKQQADACGEKIQESAPFRVECDDGDVFVCIIDSALKETLRKYLKIEDLYELKPKVLMYIKS